MCQAVGAPLASALDIGLRATQQGRLSLSVLGHGLVLLPSRVLPTLQEYPAVPKQAAWTPDRSPEPVDWDALLADVLSRGAEVPEVDWCPPGEQAALQV